MSAKKVQNLIEKAKDKGNAKATINGSKIEAFLSLANGRLYLRADGKRVSKLDLLVFATTGLVRR